MNKRWHRRGALLALVVLALVELFGLSRAAEPATKEASKTVTLTIDFGDGVELRFKSLPWREGMTGLDLLKGAQAHPRGVKFTFRGDGARAIVTKIGDLENQGGGRESKNWLYSVNDKPADEGIGAYEPKPGDAVLWKFSTYGYNSSE